MIELVYGRAFWRSGKKLSKAQQDKLAKLLLYLCKNPFHPLLHSKPLVGKLSGFYSFRVTRDYRVIFRFLSEDVIELVEIGHRKEIYR